MAGHDPPQLLGILPAQDSQLGNLLYQLDANILVLVCNREEQREISQIAPKRVKYCDVLCNKTRVEKKYQVTYGLKKFQTMTSFASL